MVAGRERNKIKGLRAKPSPSPPEQKRLDLPTSSRSHQHCFSSLFGCETSHTDWAGKHEQAARLQGFESPQDFK